VTIVCIDTLTHFLSFISRIVYDADHLRMSQRSADATHPHLGLTLGTPAAASHPRYSNAPDLGQDCCLATYQDFNDWVVP